MLMNQIHLVKPPLTATCPQLIATSLQWPLFWRTVNILTLVYTYCKWSFSSVPKMADVEGFNYNIVEPLHIIIYK